MKKQFLKIAGVKTEDEFYNKYPSEEDFFKAHPEALKQLARGGEAFPQIATMDNFFTYGSPVPPTYYAHGGAFPMAQSEEQFFSPYYGNIPNPYNKAMGGSAMSFPYGDTGPSTHFMMQDGGYMPEEEPLPRMGVKGYLTDFIGAVKNTAAKKINDNLALHGAVKNPEQYDFEQARYGGNLKTYESKTTSAAPNFDLSKSKLTGPVPQMDAKQAYDFYRQSSPATNQFSDKTVSYNDPNSDKGTTNSTSSTNPSGSSVVNNYYYGSQDPHDRNYNSNPYANTRVRGSFGRYNQPLYTDKKAMDALGVSHFNINTPKTALGRFFRPTTIDYYRDVPGGQGNQQGMPVTPAAQIPGQQAPGATTQDDQKAPKRPRRNFFGRSDEDSRWTPEDTGSFFSSKVKNVEFPMGESTFETEGYKDFNRNADFKNWKATQKLNKLGERLDRNYQREKGLKDLYGTEISNRDERLRNRDTRRYNRIAEKFDRDQYTQPTFAYGGYTTYAKGGSYNAGDVVDMTPEEIQRFIEMGGQVEFLD